MTCRNIFIKTLLGLLVPVWAGICVHAENVRKDNRPNIVWIFSDDHSFQTIGAYGGRLKTLNPTPNIDRLAEEGMRFDRCYVGNSICSPSRATLLTGKHSHMNGKYTNHDTFDHTQQQFQGLLQQSGYQTAMIGKIHIDGQFQGFDYWEVLPSQGHYYDPDFIKPEGKTKYRGYVTDVITDLSLEWLRNQRDTSKPFMLMIHHKAPHRYWYPAGRDMLRYEDTLIPEPDNLFDDYATRTTAAREQDMTIADTMVLDFDLKIIGKDRQPTGNIDWDCMLEHYDDYAARNRYFHSAGLEGKELVRWKYQTYMKDYLRCIWSLDENIGRVLDTLEELGLSENTVVMYCSDQGFYMGEHGWFDKRFMYEESFRTPFIVRWPGVTAPGSVNRDLVQNIDFAETFLDIAGARIPEDMQGLSLRPLFKGQKPVDWRKSLYYHYYEYPAVHSVRRHEGVLGERYKLIRFYGQDVPGGEEWELYDLREDPSEMNNIYAKNPAVVAAMKKELSRLKEFYEVPPEQSGWNVNR